MNDKIVNQPQKKSETVVFLQTKNRKLEIQIHKLQNKILKLENKMLKQEQTILRLQAENAELKKPKGPKGPIRIKYVIPQPAEPDR
jgi:DNA-binding protein H-NS